MITIVLFLPDLVIWHGGSPFKAVFVLIWLHVAIAIVTYNSLLRLAPVPRGRHARQLQKLYSCYGHLSVARERR